MYRQLTEGTWRSLTVYPESVPHLLHWDVAYLWILEQPRDLRPFAWTSRVDAWRYLLGLFLTGQLQRKAEPVPPPMESITSRFGVREVSWWSAPALGNAPVAVSSPTVLLRPLPDFAGADLDEWQPRAKPAPVSQGDVLREFLHQLLHDLDAVAEDPKFAARIAAVVRREFSGVLGEGRQATGKATREEPMSILRELRWVPGIGASPVMAEVRVLVAGEGTERVWVPRCRQCGKPLCQEETDAPVPISGARSAVDLTCGTCNVRQSVPLDNLRLWVAPDHVTVWQSRPAYFRNVPDWGPVPAASPDERLLTYRWPAPAVDGEHKKRFLTIALDRRLRRVGLGDTLFRDVIVPGPELTPDFAGLPFRPEYFDALAAPSDIRVSVDVNRKCVEYSNVRIAGVPNALEFTLSEQHFRPDPDLAVGVYPSPERMPSSWRPYRQFLGGPSRSGYRLDGSERGGWPWILHSESGPPRQISLARSDDENCGVTFRGPASPPPPPAASRAVGFMGIDFGTTTTLVYAADAGSQQQEVSAARDGVKPSDLERFIGWLGGTPEARRITDLLPAPAPPANADAYLIPSALVTRGSQSYIRWALRPQEAGTSLVTGFKWDEPGHNRRQLRAVYLRELLFLTLPALVETGRLGHAGSITIETAWSFPLAFDRTARDGFADLIKDLTSRVRDWSSVIDLKVSSIDESTASIVAWGSFNRGERFLVADLGGGTLDVSLFRVADNDQYETRQIGSIRYGGTTFVDWFGKRSNWPAGSDWKLHDALATGTAHEEWGGDSRGRGLCRRFLCRAFEFVRTMAMAEGGDGDALNLLLVGNGWRLPLAFTEQTGIDGPQRVYTSYFADIVARMNTPGLRVYADRWPGQAPASKHLVVMGALKMAKRRQAVDRLGAPREDGKLPMGRTSTLTLPGSAGAHRINWSAFAGDGCPVDIADLTPEQLATCPIDFAFDDGPSVPASWKTFVNDLKVGEPGNAAGHPAPPRIREMLRDSIVAIGQPRFGKGVLQILLESAWSEYDET